MAAWRQQSATYTAAACRAAARLLQRILLSRWVAGLVGCGPKWVPSPRPAGLYACYNTRHDTMGRW
jgi:hypothetical protein